MFISIVTAPTAPPSNPHVAPNNSTSLTFSWSPPPADKINGNIRRYVTEITEHETQSTSQYLSTTTAVTLHYLHPHYSYVCRVAAETIGIGPYTSNVTVQLPEDGKILALLTHNCKGYGRRCKPSISTVVC